MEISIFLNLKTDLTYPSKSTIALALTAEVKANKRTPFGPHNTYHLIPNNCLRLFTQFAISYPIIFF